MTQFSKLTIEQTKALTEALEMVHNPDCTIINSLERELILSNSTSVLNEHVSDLDHHSVDLSFDQMQEIVHIDYDDYDKAVRDKLIDGIFEDCAKACILFARVSLIEGILEQYDKWSKYSALSEERMRDVIKDTFKDFDDITNVGYDYNVSPGLNITRACLREDARGVSFKEYMQFILRLIKYWSKESFNPVYCKEKTSPKEYFSKLSLLLPCDFKEVSLIVDYLLMVLLTPKQQLEDAKLPDPFKVLHHMSMDPYNMLNLMYNVPNNYRQDGKMWMEQSLDAISGPLNHTSDDWTLGKDGKPSKIVTKYFPDSFDEEGPPGKKQCIR